MPSWELLRGSIPLPPPRRRKDEAQDGAARVCSTCCSADRGCCAVGGTVSDDHVAEGGSKGLAQTSSVPRRGGQRDLRGRVCGDDRVLPAARRLRDEQRQPASERHLRDRRRGWLWA